MQIVFRTTPEAKKNVLHHFGRLTKTTVIPTHDGAHVTVHADGPCEIVYRDAYMASTWPGVETVNIALRNLG